MPLIRHCPFGIGLAVASIVTAQDTAAAPLFTVTPLGDGALAAITGGASPFAPLNQRQLGTIVQWQARADLQVQATIGRSQMDVWWGSTGSELIAQSVRGTLSD